MIAPAEKYDSINPRELTDKEWNRWIQWAQEQDPAVVFVFCEEIAKRWEKQDQDNVMNAVFMLATLAIKEVVLRAGQ